MNSKYYITVDVENGQCISKVFLSSTNQIVYTSKPYNTKEQAIIDARTFVTTSAPPQTNPEAPKTVTSTATYTTHGHPSGPGPSRCCGR